MISLIIGSLNIFMTGMLVAALTDTIYVQQKKSGWILPIAILFNLGCAIWNFYYVTLKVLA